VVHETAGNSINLHLEESFLILLHGLDLNFLKLDDRLKVNIGRGLNFLL
jgi:hypothetical protein